MSKLKESISKQDGQVQRVRFVGDIFSQQSLGGVGVDNAKVGSAQWAVKNDAFRITMAFKTEIRGPDSLELTKIMKHNTSSVKSLLRSRNGCVDNWASETVRQELQRSVLKRREKALNDELCWICHKPKVVKNQDGVHRCMVNCRFSCEHCGHMWGSGCAWINPDNEEIKKQLCAKCGMLGTPDSKWEPHAIYNHEEGGGGGGGRGYRQNPNFEKQHRSDLCVACLEWGDCRSNFIQPNVVNGAISLACGAANMHWFADDEGIKAKLVYNGHENEVVIMPFVRVQVNERNDRAEFETLRFFDTHVASCDDQPQRNPAHGQQARPSYPTPERRHVVQPAVTTERLPMPYRAPPNPNRAVRGGKRRSPNSHTGTDTGSTSSDRGDLDDPHTIRGFQPIIDSAGNSKAPSEVGSYLSDTTNTNSSVSGISDATNRPVYLGANFTGTNKKKRRERRPRRKGTSQAGSYASSESGSTQYQPVNPIRQEDLMTAGLPSGPPSSHNQTSPPGSAVAHSEVTAPEEVVLPSPAVNIENASNYQCLDEEALKYHNSMVVATPPARQDKRRKETVLENPGAVDPRAFVDRLERLCRMRRKGNLSQEEFDQHKKRMLYCT